MKTITLVALLVLSLAAGAGPVQDMEPAPAAEGHEWLQQLVGEWEVTAEATMGPGTEPMTMKATEKVRPVGDLWILAESEMSVEGMPVSSVLTLGYDPAKGKFVGTWIDTMQPYLWKYEGDLDESGKRLVLETEGPTFADPTEMASYREVIELKSADHKTFSSSVQGADGSWTTFLRADHRRQE